MHDVPLRISIHAPRTGSDMDYVEYLTAKAISIHAPRTGSDSTLQSYKIHLLISIHAPRTGSDLCAVDQPHAGDGISIHAPRTGSDVRRRPAPCRRWNFNPRSPHGERRAP